MDERADLDAVRAWLAAGPQKTTAREAALRSNAIAAVDELRVAREVVEEARIWSSPENAGLMPYAAQRDLAEKVAAYDQAVTP